MTKRSILVVVATLNRDTITITINITITCSSILVVVAALNKDICLLSSSRSPTVRFLSHETPTVSKQLITVKTHSWWKEASHKNIWPIALICDALEML